MCRISRSLVPGVGLLLVACSAVVSAVERPAVSFPTGSSSVSIPVEIFENVVYLPVRIGSGPEMSFVLDTGAPETSAIEAGLTEELGLVTGRSHVAEAAGAGPARYSRLDPQRLELGGLRFDEVRMSALSLEAMEAHWGREKQGLVGGNVLRQVVSCIDYDLALVSLHDPASFEGDGHHRRVPLDLVENALLVRAAVVPRPGQPAVIGRFLIDTAVRQSFFTTPFVQRHGLLDSSGPLVENVTGFGLSGKSEGTLARLRSLSLGGYTIQAPIVQLCTEPQGPGASRIFDGIIGADLLSRFAYCLDYGRAEMWLSPGAEFPHSAPYDASGLVLAASGDDLRRYSVMHVVEGSPAAAVGIQPGDRLLTINDRPVDEFSLEELRARLSRDGRRVCLVIERDGHPLRLGFVLRALL